MASTFSSLKIELIGTGEKTGTWGVTTNTNLGTALEEAITGSADVTFASGTVTLTLTDVNTTQSARNLRLNLIGTSGGAQNLIVPAIEKLYLINNACADAITVKNSTGTGIAVPAGKSMFVYNNATNVVDAVTYVTGLATLASPTFTGTVTLPTLVGTATTEATSPTVAAFKTAGGLGVAKDARFGKDIYQSYAGVGTGVYQLMSNTDNTNTGSSSQHDIQVGGTSAGDPFTRYIVSGTTYCSVGLDNSDGDAYKVSFASALGTGDALKITTAGVVEVPTGLKLTGAIGSAVAGAIWKSSTGGLLSQAVTGSLNDYSVYEAGGTNAIIANPTGTSHINMGGSFGRGAPITKTANFTVAVTENWFINNKVGSICTVTLPTASSFPGRELMFNNYQFYTVVSAASNVVQRDGASTSTAILAATQGAWATLVSNGTNWVIMQGN